MEACREYEKKGLAHSRICRLFINGALMFLVLKIGLMLINTAVLCTIPEEEIGLTDTGYSYRFEMFWGYAQCRYEHLPAGTEMVGNKVFCIAFVALGTLTKDLPVLLVMACLQKILSVIHNSHSPFVYPIVVYTRRIGWILILTGIFGEAVLQMGIGLLAFHTPNLMNPLDFFQIFSGAAVLLAGDLLKWGCELQEFSDETL